MALTYTKAPPTCTPPPPGPLDRQQQVLVSMLSTAYEAHFNAPLFYRELKDNTVPRYSKMVSTSFLASVVTMMAVRVCFAVIANICMGSLR